MKNKLLYKCVLFSFSTFYIHTAVSQERPQTPKEPFPYESLEVVYQVKSDTSVHLAATLTLPEGKAPFPAVLIIGGSGQTSRNQPFYNHQTLLVLSDYLTRRGFATLRFDDRGAGKSTSGTKKHYELEESDYLADAAAGLEFLKAHPNINSDKIGIIGHSAGATQGLNLAADQSNNVWFSIMLAGAVNNYPHMIVAQQSKLMAKVSRKSSSVQHADSTFITRSIYYTINEPSYEQRVKAIQAIADQELAKLSRTEREQMKKPFYTRVNILSSEQFHKAAQQKQEDYLLSVKCPVLTLLGDNDLNVDAKYYAPKMKASMAKNYHKKSQLHVLPGINHMMQYSKTGLSEESNDISETINSRVLKIIGTWLAQLDD